MVKATVRWVNERLDIDETTGRAFEAESLSALYADFTRRAARAEARAGSLPVGTKVIATIEVIG